MKKFIKKINESPINFFSDLFIVAMVTMWIVDNVYESIVATSITVSSIILSHQTGTPCYDTSMWTSIGTNVAVPLGAGGALWMITNGVQHAIANKRGQVARYDFPPVPVDEEENEENVYETVHNVESESDI